MEQPVPTAPKPIAINAASRDEIDLISRARRRDADAFRTIIKLNNQRLYRLARGIVRNDAEAEDVVQEAYLQAFAHLDGFRGQASLSTWLSRIAINEALGRLRRRRRAASIANGLTVEGKIIPFPLNASADDPERTMAQREILQLIERATDDLPELYRVVFVARVIEGLSLQETADLLGLREATVKTRLHRARAMIRKELDARIGPVLLDAFPFAARRCDRLTAAVMMRLGFPE